MSERRKHARFQSSIDIEYRTLTQNPIYGKAVSLDLSRNGIRLPLADSKLIKGTPVEFKMNVPGDNLPVFAIGEVSWANGLQAGIRLTKVKATDRARILEYLYHTWLKSRKKQKKVEN